ncbi:MAG: collagen-binding domain-containing protein [Burkholderiales bacterium]|nr:collagen-binding domain-containing protein [Burkholderiales bacterium]
MMRGCQLTDHARLQFFGERGEIVFLERRFRQAPNRIRGNTVPRLFAIGRAVFFCSLFCTVQSVNAASSPELERALNWLQNQVQTDGTLAAEGTSIATGVQARAETATAFKAYGPIPNALVNGLTSASEDSIEYIARKAGAMALSGRDASSLFALLVAEQNPDGGFGELPGHASNVLDTAYVLVAMRQGSFANQAVVSRAVDYLAAAANADGGYGIDGGSAVYPSAEVLLALNGYAQSFPLAATITNLKSYLVNAQVAGKYAGTLDSAVAVLALAGASTDSAIFTPAVADLISRQTADGSWSADPYLTALVIRALTAAAGAAPSPTTGQISGTVVSDQDGAALENVQVSVNGSVVMSTGAAGTFNVPSLAPGAYTLQITKAGYTTVSANVTVSAGAISSLGTVRLQVATTVAGLRGQVRDTASTPIAGASIALSGGPVTTSDANGNYQIAGIMPGTYTITVTKAGFLDAVASASFNAGQVILFSPLLTPGNQQPPTTATLRARVVNAATGQPINGASARVGTVTATSDTDGRVTLTGLPSGPATIELSAAGYVSATFTTTLALGVNELGNLAVSPPPATIRITGKVTEAQTNLPVAGALVRVQDSSLTATTSVNGTYAIEGVTRQQFIVVASAAGYLSKTTSVALSAFADATVDVVLDKVESSGVTFRRVSTNLAAYPPYAAIEVEAEILSSRTSSTELILTATILDAQGTPIMEVPGIRTTAPANAPHEVELETHNSNEPAGQYSVLVRAFEVIGNEVGRVVAEGTTSFQILPQTTLSGGVTLSPPILQAGSNQPVGIVANVANHGNLPIQAGQLELTVTLENPDTSPVARVDTSTERLLSGSPLNAPVGVAYDPQGNMYVLNQNDRRIIKVAADGQSTIFATLPASHAGPPAVSITPRDLMRDAAGNLQILTSEGPIYRLGVDGTLARQNTGVVNAQSFDLDVQGNFWVLSNFNSNVGLHKVAAGGGTTTVAGNGLSTPSGIVQGPDGQLYVSNSGDNTISRVSTTGSIETFVSSGLSSPNGLAFDATGNLFVANSGTQIIKRITPSGVQSTYASGLSSPSAIRFDGQGNLFVANRGNNTIAKIPPNGTPSLFAKSLVNSPLSMRYDSQGNLYLLGSDGQLVMLNTSDTATVIASGLAAPQGVALAANGDVYVTSASNGRLVKVSGGVTTVVASGLATPHGVALDGSGKPHVTERGGVNRISSIDAQGVRVTEAESLINVPVDVHIASNGDRFILNQSSLSRVPADGSRGNVVANSGFSSARGLAPSNDGGYYIIELNAVKKWLGTATAQVVKGGLPSLGLGAASTPDGGVLVGDYNNRKILKVSPAGGVSEFAALAGNPYSLTTDLAGGAYVLYNGGQIVHVNASGSTTLITAAVSAPQVLTLDATNNRLYVRTSFGISRVDLATKAVSALLSRSGLSALAVENGSLFVLDSSREEALSVTPQGQVTSLLCGFSYPGPMAWDGNRFIFADTYRLMALVPGGNPKLLLMSSGFTSLDAQGGVLYGAITNTVYRFVPGTDSTAQVHVQDSLSTGALVVAARPDGALSVGSTADSRVITLNPAKQVIASYAGIYNPTGIDVDAAGNVFVSSTGSNQIIKIDPTGKRSERIAVLNYPTGVHIEQDGSLLVNEARSLVRIDPQGNKSIVATINDPLGSNLTGIAKTAQGLFVTDGTTSIIRRVTGQSLTLFAAGLTGAGRVKVNASGVPHIASSGSGTVVAYGPNGLGVVAAGMSQPYSMAFDPAGKAYVAGIGGWVYVVGSDGGATELSYLGATLLTHPGASAMAISGAGNVGLVFNAGISNLLRLKITSAPSIPPAGTVLHTATRSFGGLPVDSNPLTVDFGTWVPPYAGDFKFSVKAVGNGVPGAAMNLLHVGALALANIAPSKATVAPGDSSVGVNVRVTGGDFTTISKVDSVNISVGVSTGVYPTAMGADAAGNVLVLVGNTLSRFHPGGASTVLYSAPLTTGFRMYGEIPVDNAQNIYFAENGPTLREVKKISPSGVVSVVASIPEPIRGMVRDSTDQLFVLGYTRIYRVTQSGVVTALSSPVGGGPYVMTIDGHDNLYLLTNSNSILRYRPDGSVTDILPRGEHRPTFEYEGAGAIAGDCADNLFVAPYSWPQVGQGGEEYTLVQVSGKTGSISQILDGRKINQSLTDIDFIVYDRFSGHLLMWTDVGNGRVYRIPVTCGAISADLQMVFSASQSVSGFNVAPKAVKTLPDGAREVIWSLKDVNALGSMVSMTAGLASMTLGESRPVAKEAFLTFRNSFAAGEIKLPLTIPEVGVDSFIDMAVATDKLSYPANSSVLSQVLLTNRDAQAKTGVLIVDIADAQGVQLAQIASQNQSVSGNGTLTVEPPFNTGTFLTGTYQVKARLIDPATGVELAAGQAGFDIVAEGVQLISTVTTNKQAYDPLDAVAISSRVKNVSVNAITSNLRVEVNVIGPGGHVVYTNGANIAQLVPSALRDVSYTYRLNAVAPGGYVVEQRLLDAAGAVVETRSANFSVLSSADTGSGLRGALSTVRLANAGDPVALTGTVRNQGNATQSNLPLTLRVTNSQQQVVQQWTDTQTIAIGQQTSFSRTWNTAGMTAGVYTVTWSTSVGGRTISLGQDSVQVGVLGPISFTSETGVPLQSVRTSNTVAISGIIAPMTAAISGDASAEFRINGGAFGRGAQSVKAGDTLQVRLTAANDFSTAATATLTLGGTTASYTVTTETADTTPNAISFAPQTEVPLASERTSNTVTVSGINTSVPISITGGSYSLNGGPFVATAGTARTGDTLALRQTSSAQPGTKTTVTVAVGTVSAAFEVTTLNADTTPDPFTFTAQTGVPLSSVRTSNLVTIAGINTPVPVSVSGGTYSVNGGAFVSAAGTIKAGDTLALRQTASANPLTTTSSVVSVSSYSTGFNVTTEAVITPTVGFRLPKEARVLVLLSCKGSSGNADDPGCLAQKKQALEAYLAATGWSAKVVTDKVSFQRELRCGRYNTFWVSGGFEKLGGSLIGELREAVYAGSALVVDGLHDQRNSALDDIAGIRYRGKPPQPSTVVVGSAVLPAGSFAYVGNPLRLDLTTGQAHARFGSSSGDPAIVINQFGRGKSMHFAFDLAGTLLAQGSTAFVGDVIEAGIEHLAPQQQSPVSGDAYLPVQVEIGNVATIAQTFDVVLSWPSSFAWIEGSPATVTQGSGTATWRVTIAANQQSTVRFALHTPATSGSHNISVQINRVDTSSGTTQSVHSGTLPITIAALNTASTQTVSAIQALAATGNQDRKSRDDAVADVQQALTKVSAGLIDDAMTRFVSAADNLAEISSVSVESVRVSLARHMAEAGRKTCAAEAACAVSSLAPSAYGLMVFGSASLSNGESHGSVGVGGAASVSSFTVGSQLRGDSARLVAGGSVSYNNGSVGQGGTGIIIAGGAATVSQSVGRADVKANTANEDWNALKAEALALSDSLAARAGTAATVVSGNQFNCTGTNASWNVCLLTGSQLGNARTINLNYPATASVLVNVTGGAATLTNGQANFNGQPLLGSSAASRVIFNFAQAGSLSISGFGIGGTILAPRASLSHANNAIDGQVIVNGLSSTASYRCGGVFLGTVPAQ